MGGLTKSSLLLPFCEGHRVLLTILLLFPFFVFKHSSALPVEAKDDEVLQGCLKSPETVLIECRVLNAKNATCLENNVISVPVIPENEHAEINCTSLFPIDLSFEGFQLDDFTNLSYVRNAENVFNEATFVFSVGLSLSRVKASRQITVGKYSNSEQKTSFFVFRPGQRVFSSNLKPKGNQNEKSTIILRNTEKTLILPCIPNDPEITPVLEPESVPHFQKLEQFKMYDKTKGFILKTEDSNHSIIDPAGNYRCKAKKSDGAEEEIISFQVQPHEDRDFSPRIDKIYLFQNSELHISCKYGSRVILEGLFRNSSISPKPIVSDTSLLPFGSEYREKHIKIGDTGKIMCKSLQDGSILKTWNIETLDIGNNSLLQLRKISETQITCQSSVYSADEMKLQVVFCQGETECKLNEFCFDEKEKDGSCVKTLNAKPCNLNTQESVAGQKSSLCLTLPRNDSMLSQGMIRCSAGNHTYQTKYFVGFDSKLYLNWEDAPVSALVDIFVPNVTMYPQNSYPFGCKTVKFISDGRLQWVVRGKDGSEILLHKNRVKDIYRYYASDLDYQLYTVRESNILLIYPNDYDIVCLLPRWNSTAFVRHHKRITVEAKVAPVTEIVSASAAVILVLIAVVIYVMWRLKKAKEAIRNLTEKEVQEFMEGNPEALKNVEDKDAHEVVDSLPYDQKYEIPREKLLIDSENILGKGAFGTVLKGRVEGIGNVVAVKTVNSDCEVSRFKGFLSELKIMIYIGKHPNIVSLIGASTEKIKEKTLYIVVEFCANGSLEYYLRKYKGCFLDQIVNNEIKPGVSSYENVPATSASSSLESMINTVDLVKWSYQVAHGMEFLAKKKVVHADLAARNVLVDANGNCKITDFGLSRQLFDYTQYVKKQQEPLPWRWMAIESLQQLRFSSQSDVWAYGVLLWEIFSLGDMPYPGLAWDIHFVQELCNGLRLNKPTHCTSGIYNLMLDCWQQMPENRPQFSFIAQYFKSLLETLDIDVDAINAQPLPEEKAIYINASALVPGYSSIGDLVDVDIGSDRKSTNLYINS